MFAEATLIPDLIKTDEDEASAEDLGRVQPHYPPQHTDSVLEPRPSTENGQ